MNDDELDDVYDRICDIEVDETYEAGDDELSERGQIAEDIVTLWGNALAEENGWYEEDENNGNDINLTQGFIGAIVGDIVGSVYEFKNHRSKNFPLFSDKCFATDDSIMTLAIADAVRLWKETGNDLSKLAVERMQSIGRAYPHCGFGGRFFRWIYTDKPAPYYSFGNGAAMRVSSVAYTADSIIEVKELSHKITAVTHNHPEGLKGAEATATVTWMALNGFSKDEIGEYVKTNYYPLGFTLDEIRLTYQFNETCQDTVPQAIQAFLESVDFEDAIRNAISIGGDSDTLAAITGAIAGAYYGVPETIMDKARSFLDDDLSAILDKFMYSNK
ncbi:MAG: ADP-ribosylglycohydrolase [Ruminococcaceae bacterium]|nr:ADP-ribosylglycohydrolase [Oscillospiraceae bacterium]